MSKIDTLFKVSEKTDKKIYDVLDECKDRTAFIKNALFLYITYIERGIVIDRLYPENIDLKINNYKHETHIAVNTPPIESKTVLCDESTNYDGDDIEDDYDDEYENENENENDDIEF